MGQVRGDRSDDHGPLAEVVDDPHRRLVGIIHPAEDDDEALALGGAERVHAAGQGRAAYLLEDVGLGALRRHPAQHDGHVAARAPAEGAGPGEDGLVGLGAQHGVDDEGLEAGVPGAPHLGGAGVDLGGGEGDLAGVAQHGLVHPRASSGSRMSSMLASTTSMVSRTRSTVCWSVIAPVSSRGAAPKTEVEGSGGAPRPRAYQSTKPLTPAWTITPTHERSSALRSSHHGIRVDMAPSWRC